MATIPGDVRPIAETGLGKALLLDEDEATWRRLNVAARRIPLSETQMKGWIDHKSELGDGVHSIAAPVRNAKGKIVMAISIADAAQYYAEADMPQLTADVARSARAISALAGYVE